MKYLTQKGIVHGDLATRNLLLMDVNHLKITDFGLAKQLKRYSVYIKQRPKDHQEVDNHDAIIH
jgi:serine/threonine protein kinase